MLKVLRKMEDIATEMVGEPMVYFLIAFRYFFLGAGIFFVIVPIYYSKIMDMEFIFAVIGFYLLGATFKKYLKWAKLGGYKHPYLRY